MKGKDKRKGKKQNKKQPIMPTTPNGGDKKKGYIFKGTFWNQIGSALRLKPE